MAVPETFPLHPGEGAPLFIGAGVLKTQADLDAFLSITDPQLQPTLTRGTYTWDEWAGNKGNTSLEDFEWDPVRKAAGNAIGLCNQGRQGLENTQASVKDLELQGFNIITSITNLPHEKGIEVLPKLAAYAVEHGATILEINMSCPNGKDNKGGLHPPICNTPEEAAAVLEAIDGAIGDSGVMIGAKDGPHTASPDGPVDQIAVCDFITLTTPFVDFYTGINTIARQKFSKITVTDGEGGMSGPIVSFAAKRWLEYVGESAEVNMPILSLGGVETASLVREIEERRALGALLIGGTQEFYRSSDRVKLATEWTRRYHQA